MAPRADRTAAPPPSGQAATRKGFSVPVPTGWREESPSGGAGENELLVRGAGLHEGLMILRTPGAPQGVSDDAACLAAAERFSQENGTKTVSAKVVSTPHGQACQKVHTDAEMTIWSAAFLVGSDETMVVTCFYGLGQLPAPYCMEAVNGLKVL